MPEQFYTVASYRARDSVGYLVRSLYGVMRTRLEATFAQQEFTLMQWIVLMQVRDGLGRTSSDIARDFAHDSGALTRVIDQLERRGLLLRRRSSVDRRVVELELTPQGRKVVTDLLPLVVAEMNLLLEPLDRQEFEQFRGMLLRVLEHLQQAPPATVPAPRKVSRVRR
jgi:DNA-binding MarR family transcriptional regulator